MSDLVGNPEDRFSHIMAHLLHCIQRYSHYDILQIPVELCGRKPGELGEVSSDSSKAFTELGWKAEKSLHNMCKSNIDT